LGGGAKAGGVGAISSKQDGGVNSFEVEGDDVKFALVGLPPSLGDGTAVATSGHKCGAICVESQAEGGEDNNNLEREPWTRLAALVILFSDGGATNEDPGIEERDADNCGESC